MRVVEISNPASFHTAQWAIQLINRNIETHVLYVDGWFDGEADKIIGMKGCYYEIFRLPSKLRTFASLVRKGNIGTILGSIRDNSMIRSHMTLLGPKFNQYFKEHDIDVIHAHYVHSGGFIAYAAGYEPCILSTWGSDITYGPASYPYYIPIIKKTLSWATIINTASEVSADIVKSFTPIDDNKMFISSWGVDIKSFNPNIDAHDLKEELGISEGPVILSFRGLESFYRIDLILRAFKLVNLKYPETNLIIGSDGRLRDDLKALTKELGIQDRVFFTGYVVGERMSKVFAMSDIYIQCPLSDGVSISGMQALASGLAMVANDVGETKALIRNGYNGLLIDESTDPSLYANALMKMLHDDSLLVEFQKNSRIMAKEKHNRKKFLDSFEKLLRGLKEGARTLDEIF